eukprot:353584-Chlamydomonas_euryale.AAC.1
MLLVDWKDSYMWLARAVACGWRGLLHIATEACCAYIDKGVACLLKTAQKIDRSAFAAPPMPFPGAVGCGSPTPWLAPRSVAKGVGQGRLPREWAEGGCQGSGPRAVAKGMGRG